MSSISLAVCLAIVACFLVTIEARRYHAHDKVAIVANTVGPFNNPTETYPVRARLLQDVCVVQKKSTQFHPILPSVTSLVLFAPLLRGNW
jgi:hypothetical protein